MNNNSLAYERAKKQLNEMLWKSDPFDFDTKKGFTGVKHMGHKEKLVNFTNELVSSFGVYKDGWFSLSLDKVPEHEQMELARLYIESIDREIEWACYGEDVTLNSSFLCALLDMLKKNTFESKRNFAEVTCKNILAFYKGEFEKLLEEACINFTCATGESYEYGYDNDTQFGGVYP